MDINLPMPGQYRYRVYDANDELCETGLALVINEDQVAEYSYSYPNNNAVIYS